jgi:hypothetical protein
MWRVFKVVGFSEQVSSLSINIMYRKLDCVIKAACLAQKLEEQHQGEVKVFVTMRSRESWPQALEERKKEIPGSEEHRTSPIVYEGCPSEDDKTPTCFKFVGGFTEFFQEATRRFGPVDLSDCANVRPQGV